MGLRLNREENSVEVAAVAGVQNSVAPASQQPQNEESSWRGHKVVKIFTENKDSTVVIAGIAAGVCLIGSLIYAVALKIHEHFMELKKQKAEKAEEIVSRKLPSEMLEKIKQVPLDVNHVLIRLADANSHELTAFKYILENFDLELEDIAEMLKGAHLHLYDQGNIYQRMKSNGKERISSHPSTLEQFSIQGKFGKEWLFGIKLPENEHEVDQFTTLQLESHSVNGVMVAILHVVTYFKYLISGKQQGPFGQSVYTDKSPLKLYPKQGSPLHKQLTPKKPVIVAKVVPEQTIPRYQSSKAVLQNQPSTEQILAEWTTAV